MVASAPRSRGHVRDRRRAARARYRRFRPREDPFLPAVSRPVYPLPGYARIGTGCDCHCRLDPGPMIDARVARTDIYKFVQPRYSRRNARRLTNRSGAEGLPRSEINPSPGFLTRDSSFLRPPKGTGRNRCRGCVAVAEMLAPPGNQFSVRCIWILPWAK